MAKKMRRFLALAMVLALCVAQFAFTASAKGPGGHGGGGWNPGGSSNEYEWYEVYVQDKLVASAQGNNGDVYWLGITYTPTYTVSGSTMTWIITTHNGNGNVFSGSVNLNDYITIPDGYEVKDVTVEKYSVTGDNSVSDQFDNAVIRITIKTLMNPVTGETIPVPTETEPEPVKTKVTVNHNYYTEDLYTGETVLDGSTSSTADATEGDSYTATAVTAYNGNEYIRQTEDAALTITIVADETANVININYLRQIDTTPEETEPPATEPPATEPEDYEPVVEVTKTADKAAYEVGETITWTITVTNTSDYPAYNVGVYDYMVGIEEVIEALEPGASETFTATSTVSETDAETGSVTNGVEIEWEDGDDIPDNEEEDEPKTGYDEETVDVNQPEPPATEPPATEPPATDPPATEPPATEPPATEPPADEDDDLVDIPDDDTPLADNPTPAPAAATGDGLIEIPDDDVPLADVPKTGDSSILFAAISLLSAGGVAALNKKRKED